MTVKELKKELSRYPSGAKVYFVRDWETVDENGILNELAELKSVTSQRVVEDAGLDFVDFEEVLLEFEA